MSNLSFYNKAKNPFTMEKAENMVMSLNENIFIS